MSKRIKYVYLQPGQVPPQEQRQPQRKQPAPAPQPKPQRPPVMDGLAWAMLLAVAALWLFALVANASEIDWQYTQGYQASIERCTARETGGEPYGFNDAPRNCMNHNGFMQLVKDGRLVGWQNGRETFPKATTAGVKS